MGGLTGTSGVVRRTIAVGAALAAIAIVIMVFSTMADVTRRGFLGRPVTGVTELNELLLVVAAFLALAHCQGERGHIYVELLVQKLSPRWRTIMDIVGLTVSIGIFGILLYASSMRGIESVRIGEYRMGSVPFPLWPSRLIIPIGTILLIAQLALQVVDDVRSLRASAPEVAGKA